MLSVLWNHSEFLVVALPQIRVCAHALDSLTTPDWWKLGAKNSANVRRLAHWTEVQTKVQRLRLCALQGIPDRSAPVGTWGTISS